MPSPLQLLPGGNLGSERDPLRFSPVLAFTCKRTDTASEFSRAFQKNASPPSAGTHWKASGKSPEASGVRGETLAVNSTEPPNAVCKSETPAGA